MPFQNKIPNQVLYQILQVYETGTKEQLPGESPHYIGYPGISLWTTWEDILSMREMIKTQKELRKN